MGGIRKLHWPTHPLPAQQEEEQGKEAVVSAPSIIVDFLVKL